MVAGWAERRGGFRCRSSCTKACILCRDKRSSICAPFAERWLPLSDEYDSDLYTLSGFFQPDNLDNTQPTVNILWTIHSWEVWDGRHAGGLVEEHLLARRTSSTPLRSAGVADGPTRSSNRFRFLRSRRRARKQFAAGSTFFDHKFVVRPEKCGEFVDTFRNDVLPAPTAQGLTLELFVWWWPVLPSTPRSGRYRAVRATRRCGPVAIRRLSWGSCLASNGRGRCWSTSKRDEFTPTWFSPLGGSQVDPRRPTEEHMSI